MNVNTNELVDMERMLELLQEKPKEASAFTPVPRHLEPEAKRILEGRYSTFIPKNSPSELARWAEKERKKKRKKIANASRRKNR